MKKREKEGRARLPWADLVRAAAIVCVVLCHAAEATFQLSIRILWCSVAH